MSLAEGMWTATFAPKSMDVMLGASGESVMVTQVEAGGYMLPDGMMVGPDARHAASNGAMYSVMMAEDGTIMASYVASMVTIMLGEHGGELMLTLAEDQMTYLLDGEAFMSGTEHMSNDRTYLVTQAEDGSWSAAFVMPMATVTLGGSEDTVTLTQNEDMSWMDAEGEAVVTDQMHATDDGRNYQLVLADGAWTATFMPNTMTVNLGTSGDSRMLTQLEAGGYTFDGLEGGRATMDTTTMAENGGTYQYGYGEDGSPMFTYVPDSHVVMLGANGGMITLMLQEDRMTWHRDGEAFTSGMEVTAEAMGYTVPDPTAMVEARGDEHLRRHDGRRDRHVERRVPEGRSDGRPGHQRSAGDADPRRGHHLAARRRRQPVHGRRHLHADERGRLQRQQVHPLEG